MAGIGGQVIKSVGKTMFTRNSYSLLRRVQCNTITKSFKFCTSTQETVDRDPAPLFFNEEVQDLLKTLTRPDAKKVFRRRKEGQRIKDPEVKFMTDKQLQTALKEAEERGRRRLQMPPVVKKRVEVDTILSNDPALQGHDTATYVFTDITFGLDDYQRLIVIREPNGVLRHARWNERHRLNQIYFPVEGKEMFTPRMFQDQYLKDVISNQEYEFILDRACLQFEPNDPDYHRVTERVYEAVNNEKHYNHLRSTRHYGPFAFYLAWNRNIDNLLFENITTERSEDAVLLIKLFNKIHPSAKSATLEYDGDDVKFVQNYINTESAIEGKLEIALKAFIEIRNAREVVADGIKKAHGY